MWAVDQKGMGLVTTNITLGMLDFWGRAPALGVSLASFSNCFRDCFFRVAAATSQYNSKMSTHTLTSDYTCISLCIYVKVVQQALNGLSLSVSSAMAVIFSWRRHWEHLAPSCEFFWSSWASLD